MGYNLYGSYRGVIFGNFKGKKFTKGECVVYLSNGATLDNVEYNIVKLNDFEIEITATSSSVANMYFRVNLKIEDS